MPKIPPIILLSGPPCSGKGTLENLLRSHFPIWKTIATGDLLREIMATETSARADHIRHIMENGLPADADVVIGVVNDALDRLEREQCPGVIMDGVIRKPKEATAIIERGWTPDISVTLTIDNSEKTREILISRACGRLFHKPSGRIYHETFNPPKTPGLDDITGEPLTRRADDNRENYLSRLSWYETSVVPSLDIITQAIDKEGGINLAIPSAAPDTTPESIFNQVIEACHLLGITQ